jgi:ApaG protein
VLENNNAHVSLACENDVGLHTRVKTCRRLEVGHASNVDCCDHPDFYNSNHFPVKLLSRKWVITESSGIIKVVEGEGVVGIQPVIAPQDSFQYISGCNFKTGMGKMEGNYVLENQHNKKTFIVVIPSFLLEAPSIMN